jgi:hypothetical protein
MFKTWLKYFPPFFFNYMHENEMFLSHHQTYWVIVIMVYDIDMPWMLMDKLHELQNYNWTQLQFCQNNSFSITMQFDYNYIHDVMLTSLIIIHQLKYDMWHYEKFGHKNHYFWNINIYCPLWLLMMVQECDKWHNTSLSHSILVIFWKNYKR